jgi:hypothetical protein
MNCAEMPRGLQRRLRPIEDPLLVGRYRAALERICGQTTKLASFSIDAAGYSPQIAEELGDPFYLGQGPDHPYFVFLGVAQLSGCLLQPNAGFGAQAFRRFAEHHRGELADLTLREAVLGELAHGKTALTKPQDLGVVRELTVEVDTVSGRIGTARSLAAMREKLLASDALWHDEPFLESVRGKARAVHGYLPARGGIAEGMNVEACAAFVPRFGGAYVLPRCETNTADRTWVLTGAGDGCRTELEGGREVVVAPLTVEVTLKLLKDEDWVDMSPTGAQLDRPLLETLETWLALDHLRRVGELAHLTDLDPSRLRRAMRLRPDAPPEFLEVEEVRLKAAKPTDWVDLNRYAPITQLRLLALRTEREDRRAIVRHLQAYLDPANLPRAYRDAPDLFWARRDEVPQDMLDLIPRWIDPGEEMTASCR